MRNEQLVDRSVPRLIESDPFTLSTTETVVAVANGAFSALDVWCKIPSSWTDDIEFRLYGRVGDARVQLKQLTLGEALKTTVASDTSAVLLSVRGWVVSAYEVSVRDPRASSGQGRLLLQVWDDHQSPQIIGGQPGPNALQLGLNLAAGAGTPGVPVGGVLTVQGHPSSTAIPVRPVRDAPRYVLATGSASTTNVVKPSVTAVGTHYLLTMKANTKRVEIQRVVVSYWGTSTAESRLVLCTSTVAPVQGSGVNVQARKLDNGDAAATANSLFSWGANLALTGTITDLVGRPVRANVNDEFVYDADDWGKPIVLRANTADSFGIRFNVDVPGTGAVSFIANIVFTEI